MKDCPTFADKADEIYAFFEGCDLSGFNSDRYDIPCLEEEFARVGMNFGVSSRRCIDVQRIYHKMEPRDLLFREQNFLKWILKGDFDTEVKAIVRDLLDNGANRVRPPEGIFRNSPDGKRGGSAAEGGGSRAA